MPYTPSGQYVAGPWELAPSPEDVRQIGRKAPTRKAKKGVVYKRPIGPQVGERGQSARALQTFLRGRGYAISVDGVRGPQTNAAVAAYHRGVKPSAFNAKSVASKPSRLTTPVARPGTRRPTPTRVTRAPVTRAGASAVAAAPAAVGPAATSSMTDEQLADQMIEAEFGPQIAALQRASAAAQAEGARQAAYLGKAFGEVAGTATQAGQLTASSNEHLRAGQETANTNMLNLFGGPGANGPAGEAAAFSDINRGELAQLASSQQAFDTNMVPVIQTQGANAQASALREAQSQMAEYLAQIQDVTAQKGSARSEVVAGLKQQRIENEQAEQALELAKGLAPSQIASAKAQAAKDRADVQLAQYGVKNAPAVAKRQAAEFGVSQARAKAELAQTKAQTKKIQAELGGEDGSIDLNDPNTRTSLADKLRISIQTKNGTWRMHPGMAQQNLNLALQQLGLAGNAQARSIANSLLQETVNNSHGRQMWGQFNYKNGKIVKTGKRFKPKK